MPHRFPFVTAGASSPFFFFQAEDGIRYLTVTGVQTCALPISCWRAGTRSTWTYRATCSSRRTTSGEAGLTRIALVLLGLVAGLAAVELGLRLLEPHDLRALHELRPHRPWLYGMQPNAAVRVGGITYATHAH